MICIRTKLVVFSCKAFATEESAESQNTTRMVGLMNRNTARLSRRAAKRTSKKKSKISKWPVTYRFVAMGTLVAYTAFGASKITLAQSPELASTAQTSG